MISSHALSLIPDDAEELLISNPYFRILFTEREHKSAYGHSYVFYLEDAIDNCLEYVVRWPEFVE